MSILITGGAGFIGSHTASALIDRGHRVRLLDSLEPPVHPNPRPPEDLDERCEFIRGDVRNETDMLQALQGVDAVYHLAAFQDYLPVFSRYFDVNVTGTALLYELIVRERLPIRKVIIASSQATLGEGLYQDADGREVLPDIRPDEQLRQGIWECQAPEGFRGPLRWQRTTESIANPQNQYGISKIAEESIALSLGRRYSIPSVAMRYSIVQGPRQSFHNAYSGACRVFCLAFHGGGEPSIYEDGQQIRDYVNIHDVVDANLLVLEDSRADYEMFHVGGEDPITVSRFAEIVAEVYRIPSYEPRVSGLYRFGDTRHICSDVSKLKALGWKPQRSTHDSVTSYKVWLDQRGAGVGTLSQAQKQMQELGVIRPVVEPSFRADD